MWRLLEEFEEMRSEKKISKSLKLYRKPVWLVGRKMFVEKTLKELRWFRKYNESGANLFILLKGIGNRSVAHRTSRQSSRAQYIADTAQDYPTKRPRTSQEGLVKIKKYK
ncbi:uncharacterized protein LOC115446939 [Manduca sexta]|uniref:Uncharacterized protein n=1 Tax=Manduca sexta TaxID=7130 RepID=A0A922CCA9_MANSE|nr:uncharacterized protein LOC115446939 [Manduca sexta]KAG6440358.1 hypothetical protein O3G_MSEX001218 [Manduca sexta]